MAINADEYKPVVGLDSIYIAEITADTAAAYTAGTPAYLAPAAEAKAAPAVNVQTLYYDDQAYDTALAEGQTEIELTLSNLDPATLASLTGGHFEASDGRVYDRANPAGAPNYALGFRSKKTNGSYRYFWYLKGRFTKPEENFATQGDTPEAKNVTLKFTGVKTTHQWGLDAPSSPTITDGVIRVWGDEDTTDFDATDWFTAVQEPAPTA